MRLPLVIVAASIVAIAGGCFPFDPPPRPSGAAPDGSGVGSIAPGPSEVAFGQVIGPWRQAPLALGDPQIAVISDACAGAAREQLGEPEANLPTALVDTRGENVATAIMADEERAIECRVRIDAQGGVTVDSVLRLAPAAVAPVAGTDLSVTRLAEIPDREGDRMLVIGRFGPQAFGVKLRFGDETEVVASTTNGWYAAWWPGHARASSIVAVDGQGAEVGTVAPPNGEVNGQMGAASWWLDPKAPKPTAESIAIQGLVMELACASGNSPKGRIQGPLIDLTETAVTVTFGVQHRPGGQDCQGNGPFPVTFQLPEPLAGRTLLDGNEVPPRDAAKPPSG
ncbi:MAG TPA: hypothetical protein VFY18_15090 [Candidatus Limnocylindrales bacterium]|nr:hypothetical protein [Candidatus Limnocylindrales bacterium]